MVKDPSAERGREWLSSTNEDLAAGKAPRNVNKHPGWNDWDFCNARRRDDYGMHKPKTSRTQVQLRETAFVHSLKFQYKIADWRDECWEVLKGYSASSTTCMLDAVVNQIWDHSNGASLDPGSQLADNDVLQLIRSLLMPVQNLQSWSSKHQDSSEIEVSTWKRTLMAS